jgi:Protein of unknown function (DUF1559)
LRSDHGDDLHDKSHPNAPGPSEDNRIAGEFDSRSRRGDRIRVWLPRCLVVAGILIGIGLIMMMIERVRETSARTSSRNNLFQFGLAMHNYNDTNGRLPHAAIYDERGNPLLSWRLDVFPFIESFVPPFYHEFKLDEPWDSPNNIKPMSQMPRLFAAPAGDDIANGEHKTHYRVFHGEGTAFEVAKGVTFISFSDGLSNVILAVEAAEAVPWTKPEELEYAPDKPLPRLAGSWSSRGDFLALMADASVMLVQNDVSEQAMRAAIVRNDGLGLTDDFKSTK